MPDPAREIIDRSIPPTAAMLDEDRVSALVGLSKKTLRNQRSKRVGLPWTKIGGAVRYPRAGVDDYLAKQTRMPKSASAS